MTPVKGAVRLTRVKRQTKKYCDVIIPRGKDNLVAIDLIVQHINIKLREKQRLLNVAKKSIL